MTPLELRLRERIDVLIDQRDRLRKERDFYLGLAEPVGKRETRLREERDFYKRLATQKIRQAVNHANQHGPCEVYETDAERREARRRTWRMSKRRAQYREQG